MQQTDEGLFATEDQMDDYTEQVPEIQTEKYLIFSSDGLMYGIKAEQVKDIITDYAITYVPHVPNYVKPALSLANPRIQLLQSKKLFFCKLCQILCRAV